MKAYRPANYCRRDQSQEIFLDCASVVEEPLAAIHNKLGLVKPTHGRILRFSSKSLSLRNQS